MFYSRFAIFKNSLILCTLTGLALSIPVQGMKRSLEASYSQTLTVTNILDLPKELFLHIFKNLLPAQLNVLCQVCKFFNTYAGKNNKDILLPYIAHNMDPCIIRKFLDEYHAAGNLRMVKTLIAIVPPHTLVAYKKHLLIDYLDSSLEHEDHIPVCTAIMQSLPEKELEGQTSYHITLKQRTAYLRKKYGQRSITFQLFYPGNNELVKKFSVQAPRSKKEIIQEVEESWSVDQKKTQPTSQATYVKYLPFLALAMQEKDIDCILTLLSMNPYKNMALDQKLSCHLLQLASYHRHEIFETIFKWVTTKDPAIVVSTEKMNSILNELIAVGKEKQVKLILIYAKNLPNNILTTPFDWLQPWIATAIAHQQWSILSFLCSCLDTEKEAPSWVSCLKFLPWHNTVLHMAGTLPGAAPLLTMDYETYKQSVNQEISLDDFNHNKKIATNICVLQEQDPAIFKELLPISYRLYENEITLQLGCDIYTKKELLNHIQRLFLKFDPSLTELFITCAERLVKKYEDIVKNPNESQSASHILINLDRRTQHIRYCLEYLKKPSTGFTSF